MEHLNIFQEAHTSFISSLSFCPTNDRVLATGSNDKHVKLWTLCDDWTISPALDYKFHFHGVNCIKWNKDGNMLASGGNDCTVNVVDVNTSKLQRNFRHESIVTCVDFNPTSNLLLVGTVDNTITMWDMRSRNMIYQILAHSEPITSVTFSQDSTIFCSSSYDGFCRIWDVMRSACLKSLVIENSPPINNIYFLADSRYLLISSMNSQLQIIDLIKEEEIKKYTGHTHKKNLIDNCYFTQSSRVSILSGSEDGCLYKWNSNGDMLNIPIDGDKIINCVSVNSTGVIACSGFNPNEPGDSSIYILRLLE